MREKWMTVVAVVLTVTAACAGGDETQASDVTLILDFVPGGIHAGIYAALGEGYFEEAGLDVDVQPPSSAADTLRLVVAEQATIGIAPVGDVAALRADGEPVQVFLALEQVPLVSLITTEAIGVSDPARLSDATVGVTGVPSDEVIARFIIEAAGAEPATVDFVTIGFDAVGNLIGRTVEAAVGFWNAEAVALRLQGEEPVVFRPEEYGAPTFPELVFFAADDTVEEEGEVLERFSAAVARGYRFALDDPETAIGHLLDRTDGVDAEFASAEFRAVSPHFLDSDGDYGHIDEDGFDRYLQWAQEVGIVASIPDDLLTTRFMP